MKVIDIYKQLLPEYMHLVCVGFAKKLAINTFTDCNSERSNLYNVTELNKILLRTKVPCELQRKTRKVSWGSFKAEEYRNLLLFYFPAVLR